MDRPLLILDLDETLISGSTEAPEEAAFFRCGPYFIQRRPFLDDFLDTCRGPFDLAIWTSSTPEYARCVRDEILGDRPLAFLWARERCTRRFDPELREHYWVKDLKKVRRAGFDLGRVLVVDDSVEKLERNYGNLVLIREFTGAPDDRELPALGEYLVQLARESDFRRIDKRDWRSR